MIFRFIYRRFKGGLIVGDCCVVTMTFAGYDDESLYLSLELPNCDGDPTNCVGCTILYVIDVTWSFDKLGEVRPVPYFLT